MSCAGQAARYGIAGDDAYYTTTLGFELLNEMEGWAAIARNGVELMFSLPIDRPDPASKFTKPTLTGSLYFRTDDIDTLWLDLKEKANILYPIADFDYGMREFAILDINGYVLQFGQEIEALELDIADAA